MKWMILYLLACAGVAELGARGYTQLYGNTVEKALGLLQPDAQLGWKARAHLNEKFFGSTVETDESGNRIVSRDTNPSAQRSYWVFGPSSAFGWGVRGEDTYSAIAARRMNASIKNFSQIGHSSLQGLISLGRETIPARAIVIFAYGINDLDRIRFFFPSFETDQDFFRHPVRPSSLIMADLASRFHSFRYLQRFANFLRGRISCTLPAKLPRRVSDAEFLANLDAFVKKVETSRGFPVIIDTPYWPAQIPPPRPSADEAYNQAYLASIKGECGRARELFLAFVELEIPRIVSDQRRLNALVKAWAGQHRISFVSAAELLDTKADFVDPVHPSARGHLKIADALEKRLYPGGSQ